MAIVTDHHRATQTPAWMRQILRIAGAYNLLFGAAAVLAPVWTLSLLGLTPELNYPAFWRCIGMIVGVYGVGYWIAASDPVRYWPILLVGLLGKVFGPIGFVWTVWQGELPGSLSPVILTNDLVWWLPFGLILFHAARVEQTRAAFAAVNGEPLTRDGRRLDEVVAEGRHLVIFLRHAGCTFCRETLADLSTLRGQLDDEQLSLVFVHMGVNSERSCEMFRKYGFDATTTLSDPGGVLYRRFNLGLGGVQELIGPRVWWRGFVTAVVNRHGVGRLQGNGFQLPGAFEVVNGEVVAGVRGESAAFRPAYCELPGKGESASDVSSVPAGSAV